MSHDPDPIDTSAVDLDSEIIALTEVLARHVHDVWVRERLSDGWRYGPRRDDERKEHPCLVSYERLPETEKEYDRQAALATLRAIIALGYEIKRMPRAAPDPFTL